jgi:putative transposase
MRGVYSQVLQGVLHRVDKTYKAFFPRGNGFPRYKGKGWFDSFTYPQLGFRVSALQLSLSRIGNVKVKLHRPLAGEVKTLTVNSESGKWYACFSSITDTAPLPENDSIVGIDVGWESFAVTSDAEISWTTRVGFVPHKRNTVSRSATGLAARSDPQAGAGTNRGRQVAPSCVQPAPRF